jgi:hypothetical protein
MVQLTRLSWRSIKQSERLRRKRNDLLSATEIDLQEIIEGPQDRDREIAMDLFPKSYRNTRASLIALSKSEGPSEGLISEPFRGR